MALQVVSNTHEEEEEEDHRCPTSPSSPSSTSSVCRVNSSPSSTPSPSPQPEGTSSGNLKRKRGDQQRQQQQQQHNSAVVVMHEQPVMRHQAHHVIEANGGQRTLKFSIENILRPEFGRVALESTTTTKNGEDEGAPRRPPINGSSSTSSSSSSSSSCDDNSQASSHVAVAKGDSGGDGAPKPMLWPAWVYCTRYSDRPSSGRSPRSRRAKKKDKKPEEKRPRTAFTNEQLARLKKEFQENRYLTEKRRQDLARELKLNESQIKIWFQNKRAKIKKASGQRNGLALHLMAQGLYNHSTHTNREGEECSSDAPTPITTANTNNPMKPLNLKGK